jgi:Arc/MetJ family transcription regulator
MLISNRANQISPRAAARGEGRSLRTTLNLDRELLEEAKAALGAASFTEAIETALREVVARARARDGWAELMGSDLSWESPEDLVEYRRRFGARAP